MILVTGRKKVGTIGGRLIYAVTETRMVRLSMSARNSTDEQKYKALLKSFDLTSNFYFRCGRCRGAARRALAHQLANDAATPTT